MAGRSGFGEKRMSEFLLMLFPISFFILLFAEASSRRNGSAQGAWSVEQGKALQIFAALMVILHHMVQTITNYGGVNKGPVTLWNHFGILFTAVFFFFSGFGLFKSYKTKERYLDGFFRKRLLTVLIPFLLTNIIYILFASEGRISGPVDVITSLTGFTLMNNNAWFVVELIFLYAAFYVCFKWSRSERAAIGKLAIFTLLLVTVALLLGHDKSKVGGHWFMGEWWYNSTLVFLMGILFAKYEERLKHFLVRRWKVIFPLALILTIGWYLFEQFIEGKFGYYREWNGHPGYPEKAVTLLVQTVLCALFVFVLLLLNLVIEFHNPVLGFLGGMSYEIFLIHEVFRRCLPGGVNGRMADVWYLALTYILTILCGWILSLADRWLLRLLQKKRR